MRLELTGRHLDVTPALRLLVDTKLAKLDRLLNDSAVSAQVVLAEERGRRRAEITVHARGERFLHGVGSAPTWANSIGQAVDKLAQQAQTLKGKRQDRKRRGRQTGGGPVADGMAEAGRGAAAPAGPSGDQPGKPRPQRTVKTSRQSVRLMTVGEALRDVKAGNDGVLVFRDAETGRVSVMYRQSSGELALVETEA
jgi:putative sigma-54 modulation protein